MDVEFESFWKIGEQEDECSLRFLHCLILTTKQKTRHLSVCRNTRDTFTLFFVIIYFMHFYFTNNLIQKQKHR